MFEQALLEEIRCGRISEKIAQILRIFYQDYLLSVSTSNNSSEFVEEIFMTYLERVKEQIAEPFKFSPYHAALFEPFDYYQFGVNFMKPLVEKEFSTVRGKKYLQEALHYREVGENVIFFANHQIEADPIALSILLDEKWENLAKNMIFVAGERVLIDPLAAPFSMGRNLLCIYSKRYMDIPPEKRVEKQLHNHKTMEKMASLLQEGGKVIYVAPSGGRDRANKEGVVEIAPLDPQSIHMFHLMARKAGNSTHFYPMALSTYRLLPPPAAVQTEIGETRRAQRAPIHVGIGPELSMDLIESLPKEEARKKRAEYIGKEIIEQYRLLGSSLAV